MNNNLKMFFLFATAFSLVALTGPLTGGFQLPTVRLVSANPQMCFRLGPVCSEPWYPAGPAMDTEQVSIFTDPLAMYTGIHSTPPAIDFPDAPCSPLDCQSMINSPSFLVTAPVAQVGYYEIQFMLANTFWNCPFNYGNSACGIQIRQAFGHMIDKISFCTSSLSVAGVCTPIDSPVPTASGGGLLSPNPCGYDEQNLQSGTNCIVGAPGGIAYHLKIATGANGSPWLYAPGSADLNAAARHLVTAGVATGFNNVTSVLTGPITGTTPNLFIRSDDAARRQLGESFAAQICYLFTGSYILDCLPYLHTGEAPITAFPGFTTSKTAVNLNWWLYTAAFSYVPFFDDSLYFIYNSRFVSGIPSIQPPIGLCSAQSVPTNTAANYMYLCNPNYDSLSTQMEFSPCLIGNGDPSPGQVSNLPSGNGLCPGTNQLSAHSAGIQAEAAFGADAFTIPVFEQTLQFGYVNGWSRVINGDGVGLPNYFTWLNAYNPVPVIPGTIRQGFSETTRSVSPYIASTRQDTYIVGNIYDPLSRTNPLDLSQQLNWMVYFSKQLDNATVMAGSGYSPPPGTLTTYRFFLRNDAFFQDSRPVTAYDVVFSYLSMVGSGSNLGTGASTISGITVLGPRVIDIGLNSLGAFALQKLTTVPVLPGRYWTGAGSSAWDSAVIACTGVSLCGTAQFALSGSTVTCPSGVHPGCSSFPANLMQVDPAKTAASFDPVASGILIGSGPWECKSANPILLGSGCTSTGFENPGIGGTYTLSRFGAGLPAASSSSGIYFRSSGDLALYIWAAENDINPIGPLSAVAVCFGQSVNLTGPCAHWQQGIGASSSGIVGINQFAIVALRYGLNWISPYEWPTNPPLGIGMFPPVLYEGSVTLQPCNIQPVTGYDC